MNKAVKKSLLDIWVDVFCKKEADVRLQFRSVYCAFAADIVS